MQAMTWTQGLLPDKAVTLLTNYCIINCSIKDQSIQQKGKGDSYGIQPRLAEAREWLPNNKAQLRRQVYTGRYYPQQAE